MDEYEVEQARLISDVQIFDIQGEKWIKTILYYLIISYYTLIIINMKFLVI